MVLQVSTTPTGKIKKLLRRQQRSKERNQCHFLDGKWCAAVVSDPRIVVASEITIPNIRAAENFFFNDWV